MKLKRVLVTLIPLSIIGFASCSISCSSVSKHDQKDIDQFKTNYVDYVNADTNNLDIKLVNNVEKAEHALSVLSKSAKTHLKDVEKKVRIIKKVKTEYNAYVKAFLSFLQNDDAKLESGYEASGYRLVKIAQKAVDEFEKASQETKTLLAKMMPEMGKLAELKKIEADIEIQEVIIKNSSGIYTQVEIDNAKKQIGILNANKAAITSGVEEAKTGLVKRLQLMIKMQQTLYPIKQPSGKTKAKIDEILTFANTLSGKTMGEKVAAISQKLLGVTYVGNKMIGSFEKDIEEMLVLDVLSLDCFTYLDYTVAFAMSKNYDEFVANVVKVRYIDGRVDFTTRKHFFTDWGTENTKIATNAVDLMNAGAKEKHKDLIIEVEKYINAKKTNPKKPDEVTEFWLPGVKAVHRKFKAIKFTKNHNIFNEQFIMDNFKEGDFVMVGTDLDGLDVTHTGILVFKSGPVYEYDENGLEVRDEKGNPKLKLDASGQPIMAIKPFYRNARSNKSVVDVDLLHYMRDRNWSTINKQWYDQLNEEQLAKAGKKKAKLVVPFILFYRVNEELDD
ncbi:Protein of uncharacterised function (DUF1460) [Mycoplasmopsis californica]|uniref:DUF1460 domain-containing protein n=1 Tax=Mycoplasmopsis equigenitalium TaxID=114883 RepID=A0ABY5J1S5_9BACT|nr:N-acetylmuramoyl-L-alanine amidase-like domain-containing protein [Mycoplasmopsis equigenitalium]UUD36669.1 DUF1460 domain-containing protein [Mycoplasmopsis equigenitalium]VEU69369.1 Protein of uncharacterised function (DUF1460) [Mycoplasmopsis californica]